MDKELNGLNKRLEPRCYSSYVCRNIECDDDEMLTVKRKKGMYTSSLRFGLVKHWHLESFLHPAMTLVSTAQRTPLQPLCRSSLDLMVLGLLEHRYWLLVRTVGPSGLIAEVRSDESSHQSSPEASLGNRFSFKHGKRRCE